MNKLAIAIVVVAVGTGCTSTRVPQTTFETPFGQFKGPKDHELEIEDLRFVRETNGAVMVTAKLIRSKTKNNPKVIGASAAQDATNWEGFRGVAGEITERAVKAAKTP